MGLLTFSMNPRREMLIETLQNHPDYNKFTKADLLEAGLRDLVYQLTNNEKKIPTEYPELSNELEWKKFYSKKTTLAEYKTLDNKLMHVIRLHDSKFQENNWLE